jgi:hypothetical protein
VKTADHPSLPRGQIAIHDDRHFAHCAMTRLQRLQSRIDRLNGAVDGLADMRGHQSPGRPFRRQSHPRLRKVFASLSRPSSTWHLLCRISYSALPIGSSPLQSAIWPHYSLEAAMFTGSQWVATAVAAERPTGHERCARSCLTSLSAWPSIRLGGYLHPACSSRSPRPGNSHQDHKKPQETCHDPAPLTILR